jgi:RimJ/RimL family protein N-acetyltransferase
MDIKIIAIAHPHHQGSRQVLEKAGLHKVKNDEHGEKKIVYHQIDRPQS